MKHILTTIIILFALSCKAQSPIISTVEFNNNDDIELNNGAYLKDVENKFNPFIGTWVWENGNSRLEIIFEKIEMVYDDKINYYEDILIGKYQFIDSNGDEKHNSLSLNITNQNYWNHTYHLIRGGGYDTDTSLNFQISDLHKNLYCYMFFELISPTQATWKIQQENGRDPQGGFTFPEELTLTKQ